MVGLGSEVVSLEYMFFFLCCCAVVARSGLSLPPLELLVSNGESWLAPIKLRDASGAAFECSTPSEETRPPPPPEDASSLLARLEGRCARLALGWWTYEWCHRRHVRQFHAEASGAQAPDWSLGGFARTEARRESTSSARASSREDAARELGRVTDVFDVGGQHCDETGAGRSSRVHFRCCDETRSASGAESASAGARRRRRRLRQVPPTPERRAGLSSSEVFLSSVDETAMCQYNVSICSRALCVDAAFKPSNVTVTSLLEPLAGVCMHRHEGWWSFEFCYKKGARQFHLEATDGADGGKATARVGAEFSLGERLERPGRSTDGGDESTLASSSSRATTARDDRRDDSPPRDDDDSSAKVTHRIIQEEEEEEILVRSGVSGGGGNDERACVEVEFEGGSECDILADDGLPRFRATTARLVCGDANALVSVVEDRTCHYLFTVTTPALCQHRAFATTPNARTVECALDQ